MILPLSMPLANVAVLLVGWLVQRRLHNAGLADLLWACCICASAIYCGIVAQGSPTSQFLVAVMGGLWAFRLIMHLLHSAFWSPHAAAADFQRKRHPRAGGMSCHATLLSEKRVQISAGPEIRPDWYRQR